MIDVLMTATRRPEIIGQTLESFFTNLFYNHREELVMKMNIDPVGNDRDNSEEIRKIVATYFSRAKINISSTAFFPQAFFTVWNMCNTPLCFNLEEDWILNVKLDFSEMLSIMTENPTLAHLRLNKFKTTKEHVKCWTHFFLWNGSFYECPHLDKPQAGWCGHPSINRSAFVKDALRKMDPAYNPEKQIKGRALGKDYFNRWRFGIFSPNKDRGPCIEDIGRKWMDEKGWRKAGNNPQHFTKWEKV